MINVAESIICGTGREYPFFNGVVSTFCNKYGDKLSELCAKLEFTDQCVTQIAEIEFEDGKTSFGRIIALYAFGKQLGKLHPSKRSTIAREIDCFVKRKLRLNKI